MACARKRILYDFKIQTRKRTYFNLKVDLSHTEVLRNCEHLFTEPSEKSIPEKHVRRKQKSHSSVNLQSSFMKNDKPTHCRDELIKKEKVMCALQSAEESSEEEVVCTRSLQHQVLNTWSHDQKIKAEIRQAASNQGNSYSSGDDMLIDSFEMMHTSPDLFSQSYSRAKVIRFDTPHLYYSPRLLKDESHSLYSKHFSGTPDLFSSPNCSPSRQEMNSVSLFSCSNHSLFSSSSSPLLLVEQPASSSDSDTNELDLLSVINQSESENRVFSLCRMMNRLLVFIQHPAMQTALLNVYTECVRRPEFHRCYPTLEDLVHTMSRKLVH